MNREIEIPVPDKKVIVMHGQLFSRVKIWISGNLESNLLIKPVIGIGYYQSDLLYLDFSTIGPAAIPCKLDFVEHVFPAFENITEISSNESLPQILTTEALSQNLRLVMFNLEWKMVGRYCIAVGQIHLTLRQQGITPMFDTCGLNEKDSIRLGKFFATLPRI